VSGRSPKIDVTKSCDTRFWYEDPAVFTPAQLTQIKQTSLGAVLCKNGDSIDRVTKDVFLLPSKQEGGIMSCENLPNMELSFWTECCQGEGAKGLVQETAKSKQINF